jgi:hypothetical protein
MEDLVEEYLQHEALIKLQVEVESTRYCTRLVMAGQGLNADALMHRTQLSWELLDPV